MNLSKIKTAITVLAIFSCAILSPDQSCHAFQEDSVDVDFVTDIKPIFEKNCLQCHSGDEAHDFQIDVRDEAMDYITPSDPDDSPLYEYLVTDSEDEMMPPPDEGGPLDDSEIQLIKVWIESGAEWPDDVTFTQPTKNETEDVAKVIEPPSPYNAVGSLHPAAIHMPIGLLMAAGLFGFLSLRGNFVMSDCAYYCLWLGALSGIFACVAGWYLAPMERYPLVEDIKGLSDMNDPLFWHRTSAIIVTALALVVAVFAAVSRRKDPDKGMMWKLGAILIAGGIGYVGHEGGELSWNKDGKHYQDLNRLMEQYIPVLKQFNEQDTTDKPDDAAKDSEAVEDESHGSHDHDSDSKSDNESATGETSDDANKSTDADSKTDIE